jgi:hypothetical protein
MWDARTGRLLHTNEEFREDLGVGPMPYAPDGRRVVRVQGDRALIRAIDGGVAGTLDAADGRPVRYAHWAPAGDRILTGAEDGPPRLWAAADGRLVATLERHTGLIAAEFSLDGKRLLVVAKGGGAHVWNAGDGTHVAELGVTGRTERIGLSDDGELAFTIGNQGEETTVWRVDQGAPLLRPPGVVSIDFDADARHMALARRDGVAEIWELGPLRQTATVQADATELFWAELSPDGAFLATIGFDANAKVWEWKSGKLLAVLASSGDVMAAARTLTFGSWSVRFSRDGERVLTNYPVSPPIVWDARRETRAPDDIAAFVASRVPWRVESGRLIALPAR